jgi:glycosyltransferase involved in cell wall biosynthesis
MYPEAPIYTSQYDRRKIDWFDGADVRTGWLNRLPSGMKRLLPVLRGWYFSHLDLREYDLVISISGAEAKAVRRREGAVHVCYLHAPTQYYWSLYDEYVKDPGFGKMNFLMRVGLKVLVGPMRWVDRRYAQRPDVLVVNSEYVRAEVKKYYGRESRVVWPPVNVGYFGGGKGGLERDGFVATGRQVAWKRFDLAVGACLRMGKKLVLVGDGPEHERLVRMAGGEGRIEFVRGADDRGIREILRGAEGFLFMSREPFGIGAVEALAAGVPVVALRGGGAMDFVVEGRNGVFFGRQRVGDVVGAIGRFDKIRWRRDLVRESAGKFSEGEFRVRFGEVVDGAMRDNVIE